MEDFVWFPLANVRRRLICGSTRVSNSNQGICRYCTKKLGSRGGVRISTPPGGVGLRPGIDMICQDRRECLDTSFLTFFRGINLPLTYVSLSLPSRSFFCNLWAIYFQFPSVEFFLKPHWSNFRMYWALLAWNPWFSSMAVLTSSLLLFLVKYKTLISSLYTSHSASGIFRVPDIIEDPMPVDSSARPGSSEGALTRNAAIDSCDTRYPSLECHDHTSDSRAFA